MVSAAPEFMVIQTALAVKGLDGSNISDGFLRPI
jgi:hypothetical protein